MIFKTIQVYWTWCDRIAFLGFLLVCLVAPERQLGRTFGPETCLSEREMPVVLVEDAGNQVAANL